MRTLTPGLYHVVPIVAQDEDDDGNAIPLVTGFDLNPAASYNRYENVEFAELPADFNPSLDIVDSPVGPADTIILSLDLGDGLVFNCTSVNSPLGPLSISESYAIVPATSRELNDAPGGQDAINWIVLDLAVDTTVSVDGGRIVIGDDVIDVAAGPDFSVQTHSLDGGDVEWLEFPSDRQNDVVSTTHVIRAGTELHSLLKTMITEEDDSVFAMLTTDAAGLAAVQAIDTTEARVVAKDLVTHIDKGCIGTVLRFHVKGAVLPASTLAEMSDDEIAKQGLVNA